MNPVKSMRARQKHDRSKACGRGRGGLVLLGALAAIVVAGCGASSPGSTTKSTAKTSATPVTIVYTAPIADQVLGSVTQAAGLFKKNGVNAKVEFLQASLALPALLSGKAQFVIVGAPSAEVASLNGTPVQYIGQWENVIDAGIAAKGSITSAKDLNHKTIAISSTGALSDFLVQIADKQYGVTMHELPLGQLPEQLVAYTKGTVDALSGVNAWQLPSLTKQAPGTHEVVNFADDKGYPGVGLVADASWVDSHRTTAVSVLRALHEGIAYYKSHPAPAIRSIEKNDSETASEAKSAYETTKAVYTNSIVPSLADQKKVLQALVSTQPKAKTFDATKLLNATFAAQAEKK